MQVDLGHPAGVWEALGVEKPTEKNLTPAEAKPLCSAKTPEAWAPAARGCPPHCSRPGLSSKPRRPAGPGPHRGPTPRPSPWTARPLAIPVPQGRAQSLTAGRVPCKCSAGRLRSGSRPRGRGWPPCRRWLQGKQGHQVAATPAPCRLCDTQTPGPPESSPPSPALPACPPPGRPPLIRASTAPPGRDISPRRPGWGQPFKGILKHFSQSQPQVPLGSSPCPRAPRPRAATGKVHRRGQALSRRPSHCLPPAPAGLTHQCRQASSWT